jgi:hypothetical protein
MRKVVVLFSLMLFTVLAFAVDPPPGGNGCTISSDEKKNTGKCRASEGGGDVCHASGTGTACNGNFVEPPQ